MRIIKNINKKVGDKKYYKYILSSISEKVIKISGLLGKKLKATAEKGRIVIEKD